METWKIILGIISACIFLGIPIWELIIVTIRNNIKLRKKNNKWKKAHPDKKLKLLCVNCKFCKTYTYHPFYKHGKYGNVFTTKEPSYCRLLKINLSGSYTRCQIRDDSLAFWEE